jgi:hypothetical protein
VRLSLQYVLANHSIQIEFARSVHILECDQRVKCNPNDKMSSILQDYGREGGGGQCWSLPLPHSQFSLYNLQFLHLAGMNLAYFPGIILPQGKNPLALVRETCSEYSMHVAFCLQFLAHSCRCQTEYKFGVASLRSRVQLFYSYILELHVKISNLKGYSSEKVCEIIPLNQRFGPN